jgi:amino acid permease
MWDSCWNVSGNITILQILEDFSVILLIQYHKIFSFSEIETSFFHVEYICHTDEKMHSKTLKIKPQVMESKRY